MSWPRWWMNESDWRTRLLAPLGSAVCTVASYRRNRFERAFVPTLPTAVTVVVGNVTVGGSGKTPLIMALGEALARRGIRHGIVSRGYGGRSAHYPLMVGERCDPAVSGDEPCLLARRLKVPVVVSPDRAAAVRHLLELRPDVQVILSDDGLQHFAMSRDVEVVVADGRRGFGNRRCLPAGPLREPLEVLDGVAFRIRNGQGDDPLLAGWPQMRLVPVCWVNGKGERRPLDAFVGKPVRALAGIGDPERFFDQLRLLDIQPVVTQSLADHASAGLICKQVDEGGIWLMTEKDAIKCPGRQNAWALVVRAEVPDAWLSRFLERIESRLKVKYEPQAVGNSGVSADQDQTGL